MNSSIFCDMTLCLLHASRWFTPWTMNMEVTCSSDITVDFHQTTRRYIPEDITLRLCHYHQQHHHYNHYYSDHHHRRYFCVTRHRSWFRQYATSRKVAGSIPNEVTGFFNRPNSSSRTMALGSTQPLTEICTRNLPRGKGWSVGA
jgi:hypothetical protein